jgi:hypothetical protein
MSWTAFCVLSLTALDAEDDEAPLAPPEAARSSLGAAFFLGGLLLPHMSQVGIESSFSNVQTSQALMAGAASCKNNNKETTQQKAVKILIKES